MIAAQLSDISIGTQARVLTTSSANHWEELAQLWEHVGSPLRPSEQDVAFYRRNAVELAKTHAPLDALIFGVTPELYLLPWPAGSHVRAVDRSEVMIRAIWPGPLKAAQCAAWTALPVEDQSCDIVMCDGGLQLLDWPIGHQLLAHELERVIRPGGRLVVRMFVPPDLQESADDVLDELIAGKIPNLNILKIRLGMAMARGTPPVVRLRDVWDALNSVAPDLPSLAPQINWPIEHLQTINTYRDASTRYAFICFEQLCEIFCQSGVFAPLRVEYPAYLLGERCPTVTLEHV